MRLLRGSGEVARSRQPDRADRRARWRENLYTGQRKRYRSPKMSQAQFEAWLCPSLTEFRSDIITLSVVQTERSAREAPVTGKKMAVITKCSMYTRATAQLAMVSSYLVVVKGHLSLAPDGPEFCLDPTVGSVDSSPRRVRIL